MKKIYPALLISWIVFCAASSGAQQITQGTISINPAVIVNFTDRANYEAIHPVTRQGLIPQGEDLEEDFEIPPKPVDPGAVHFDVVLPQTVSRAISPAPSISFNGVMSTSIYGGSPPDVSGAVGPNHVLQTTNKEFRTYTRTGTLISTVSYIGLFYPAGARWCSDPHSLYDPLNGRWLLCSTGRDAGNIWHMYVGISLTTDPTGNWYVYSFASSGNTYDVLDYPLMGYNTNWVAITSNFFLNGGSGGITGKIYVMNRAMLYTGTLGTATSFTDANVHSLAPAQTYDATQNTLYMVQDWNGNTGGNGYVRISTITGTPNAPLYSTGSQLGVNQPWASSNHYSLVDARQAGTTARINTIDTRIGNALYRNGSLWFCQSAYLPASSPTRVAVQWWQVNPAVPSVQQFGRVDGGSSTGTFYTHPSIAVNASNDVMVGHCQFSSSTYASASYSVRAAADAANTLQSPYLYKSGIATHTLLSGGRIRWGDYTGAYADPTDNSFWNFNEWANSGNLWATAIANVAVPNNACSIPSGLSATPVGNTYATFNWSAVTGATSYRIQYRITGSSVWTTVTTINTFYTATGLIQGTQYQWQVQAICSGGPSLYSSALSFATTGTAPCSIPSSLSTFYITSTNATLSWSAVTGAVGYNFRYRIIGSPTWISGSTTASYTSITGLTPGNSYEWQVQTICSGSTSAFSASATFNTPVPAVCNVPVNGITSTITPTSARFSWSAATGALSYNLWYRASGVSAWNTVNTLNTYYNAVGLTGATNYEWKVQSLCQNGSSVFSILYHFTTTVPVCDIPISLFSSYITTTSATLQWNTLNYDTSYRYNVRYRLVGASSWITVTIPYSFSLHSLSGLTANSDYEWQVQTICTGGTSAYSAIQTFTTAATEWCVVPTIVGQTNLSTTSINLSWAAVNGALSYNIRYCLNPGSWVYNTPTAIYANATWINASTSSTSYTVTGLSPGTAYLYQVQTVCAAGITAYSQLRGMVTTNTSSCNTVNGGPGSVLGGYPTSQSLSWNPVSGALSYNFRYRAVGAPAWTTISLTSTNYYITGLTPNLAYEYQVQTVCSGGLSKYWPVPYGNFYTSSTTSCSSPIGFGVYSTSVSSTYAQLYAYGSSGSTAINMRYRPVGSLAWTVITINIGSSWSYFATGLIPGTEYELQAQAVCPSGTSAYMAAENFTTQGAAYCNKITGLLASSITTNSAVFSWSPGTRATGYNIRYRPVGTFNWVTDISTAPTYNCLGLIGGTQYEWQVQQVCPSTTSGYENFLSFTTSGFPSCRIPTNLGTSLITLSTATFNWTAAAGAIGYNIQYRAIGSSTWLSGTPVSNIYNATGLNPGTEYEWKVQTRCSGDTSRYVNAKSFATVAIPACSDVYELNNTSSAAFLATINTTFTGYIDVGTDVDWFKFVTLSPYTNVQIDLTNLPADYDIQLYASDAVTLLGSSQNRGTLAEQIKRPSSSAATYYLKVYGYNSANSSAQCYRLQVAASSLAYFPQSGPPEIRSTTDISDSLELESVMKLFPNPANEELNAEFISSLGGKINLNVYNLSGQKVIIYPGYASAGFNKMTIATTLLSNGIYILEIQDHDDTQRMRFAISR